jgi:hypothetical protein
MDTLARFYLPIIGFVVTVAFGFWVSKLGRPYNGLLFNIHKLIALGTVIITSMRVYAALKGVSVQTLIVGLVVLAGLSVVVLFVSGAFLSIGNVKYEVVKLVHNVAPVVVTLAMGLVIYWLAG